jgi:hypothetical protein
MCGFAILSASKALKSEVSRLLHPTCKTNYKSSRFLGPKQSPSAPHTRGGGQILQQSNAISDCLSQFSDPNKIPKMPAASQIVIILFLGTSSFTWSTFSTVLLTDGHPQHSALLMLLLNVEKHCSIFPFTAKPDANIRLHRGHNIGEGCVAEP